MDRLQRQPSQLSRLCAEPTTAIRFVVVVCNFTPQPHAHYRIGVPAAGFYREIFNSDARPYGGSNMGNLGGKWTDEWSCHNRPYSLDLCLPPLATLVLELSSAPES